MSEFPEVLTEGGSQGVINLVLAEDAYDIIDTYISVASVTVRLVSTH